ncbi:hypothetical protein CAPTEDRAFT_206348 [Capitella teleta]|uniref:SGNH domain-containing protein n=1 Tax=Capitella teleta TaxID=283909 RepID=R7UCE3_CAPTE|nr:hypothetical protein CAPTEDRAFT_206348 [Capitella teleta]|eukprot:ELU03674.1 hypothetical protein CAPTEDRAFT_206348 [Capitella teleta]
MASQEDRGAAAATAAVFSEKANFFCCDRTLRAIMFEQRALRTYHVIKNFLILLIVISGIHLLNHRNVLQEGPPLKPYEINRSRPKLVLSRNCEVPKLRKHLPSCSTTLFRQYFRAQKAFPECGRWIDGNLGFGYTESYSLDFCQWEAFNFADCLAEDRVKRVFMAGDSNGFQLFLSMLNLTIAAGANCDLIRSEGEGSRLPNGTYLAQLMNNTAYEKAFTIENRRCKLCRAQEYECQMQTLTGPRTINFEFMGYYFFKDPSLQVLPKDALKYGVRSFKTAQEFMFQVYLPQKGYPDVIFMPIPFNHEKWNKKPEIFVNLRELSQMIRRKKPPQTRIFWIPTAGEVESKRSALAIGYKNKTFDGLLAAPYIYTLNKLAFSALESSLTNPYSNVYGFINVANMSMQKEEWNLDGIHYNYQWYAHVVKQLWSMMCSRDNFFL